MKLSMKLLGFVICLLALASLPFVAQAQDDEADSPDKADVWVLHVKSGMSGAFEEVFKTHLAFRAEKDDPRAWNTYTVAIGDDLGSYTIRYCCVDWADADSYAAWETEAGVYAQWNENVDQYVDSYEHYYNVIDFENNNWPAGEVNFTLIGLTRWELKPDAFDQMNKAITRISSLAKEHGWPRYWSWSSRIGGSSTIAIASPFENYAAMEPPEQSFAEFLTEHMDPPDAAMELLNSFSASFKSSNYTVYQLRDDLSMSSDEE